MAAALVLLILAAGASAEVSQSSDWLVAAPGSSAQSAAVTATKTAAGALASLTLANGLVERSFTVRGGALCVSSHAVCRCL